MAVGKQIKVVLTLDDAGFSAKTKAATEITKVLDTGFKTVVGTVDKLESSVGLLGKSVTTMIGVFKGVESTLQAVVAQMQATVEKLAQVGTGARTAEQDLKNLNNATSPLGKSFAMMGKEANSFGVSMAQMKPSLAAAAASIKDLDRVTSDSAKNSKASATASMDQRIKQLKADIQANADTIQAREKLHSDLLKAENDYEGRALQQRVLADKLRATKRAGSGAAAAQQMATADGYSNSAEIIRKERVALEALLGTMRLEQAQRNANVAAVEKERVAVTQLLKDKQRESQIAVAQARADGEAIKQIDRDVAAQKKAADQAAARSAREAADARIAEERRVGREAAEQARAITQMWKGMAQGYAALKVEKGLGASVNAADQMERQTVMVKALNLAPDEEKALFASSKEISQQLKFISNLDAIKSRMSAIASIGYNNAPVIDATLGTAIKTANNLEYLKVAQGDLQTSIRNLYGVVEMRQQTADPVATKQTFEQMQKIITGTAGKVQTADMETVLRRIGMGASQLSNDGMYNLAAIVDQFKVAGGDHGGGGGGVSTVGTMIKMFQSYALGKTLSNEAVKEFAGADILKTSGLDLSKDKAGVFKDAKHAGLKNAEMWLNDPVKAMQMIMPQIIAYTQKNKGQFYGEGRDPNKQEDQMIAVAQYLSRLGITTTAQQGFMTAADPRSQERIAHQTDTMRNSKGVNEVDELQKGTYGRNLTEVKALLTDISGLVGAALLPALNEVLGVFKSFLTEVRDFASNNPLSTAFLGISAAVGTVSLAVSGFANLFGLGGLTGLVGTFGAAAGRVFPTFLGWFTSLGSVMPGFGSFLLYLGRLMVGFGAALIAFDIGWIIGRWVSHFQVGGMQIGQHVENIIGKVFGFFDDLIIGAKRRWAEFVNSMGGSDIAYKATIAELDAEAARNKAIRKLAQNESSGRTGSGAGSGLRMNASEDPRVAAMGESIQRRDAASAALAMSDRKGAGGSKINNQLAGGAPGKVERERDPLLKALEEARGRAEAGKIILQAIKGEVGQQDALRLEVFEEMEGKRLGGAFSKNGDVKNNPVHSNNPLYRELLEAEYQRRLEGEQKKALIFGTERLAAANQEAGDAMERLTSGNVAKQTDAFRALERELVRAEVRLGAGTKNWGEWQAAKNSALFERARADIGNTSADQAIKNRSDAIPFLDTARERTAAELDATDKKQHDIFKMELDNLNRTRKLTEDGIRMAADQAIAAGADKERIAKETNDKIFNLNERAHSMELQAQKVQDETLEIQAEKRRRALEEPIFALARTWKDSDHEIESRQTAWADGFVNMLTANIGKGKMQIGDFLRGIAMDIANVKLKEMLADPLKNLISEGTSLLKKEVFNGKGNAAESSGPTEIDVLKQMSGEAAKSLEDMTKNGVEEATKGMVQEAIDGAKGATVNELFSSTLSQATAALGSFTIALQTGGGAGAGGGGWLGGLFGSSGGGGVLDSTAVQAGGFMLAANGGVLGEFGSVSLRKYAAGGIANSPQLAMYGEAGPEAYVPLPDGRSIPVSLQGGGAPQVTVNVINQSGQSVSAQQGSQRFDGKQMILDVVLSAANQPGSFRDGLKGAVK